MTATATIRNRPVYFDGYKNVWRYEDTGNKVKPCIENKI